MAPEADLAIFKVLDGRGSGTLAGVLKGIEEVGKYAQAAQVQVVANMSLGGPSRTAPADDPLVQEIERQERTGAIDYCIAMGNSGPNAKPSTPAYAPSAISVAADDQKGTVDLADDAIASFSSAGNQYKNPTVSAAGVKIMSTWPGNGYREASGTSMATPHVTGGVALLKSGALKLQSEGKLKEGVTLANIDWNALVADSALDRPSQAEKAEGKGIARFEHAYNLMVQRYARPGVATIPN